MAQKAKIKLKLQKPRLTVIVAIVLVLVLSTAALLTVQIAIANAQSETDALRAQAYKEEQLSDRLQRYIQELGTIQGIIRIAQEQLGLIQPDAIIFDTETGN